MFDNVRPFYFVTFNTYKRQSLLARDEVHAAFCTFSIKAQERNVAVGRYVIMPDHVHLFAAFPIHGITLPSWVQSLRNVIGKRLLNSEFTSHTGKKVFLIICCAAMKATRRNGNMCV